MNFPDSYKVAAMERLIYTELDWVFLKSGARPPDALFVSYAYKGSDYPAYFREVYNVFDKAGINLIDLAASHDPAALIASAKAIVVGGGDITTFINKMSSLNFDAYLAIKNRIESGIPYIGWNEGSGIISPKYFSPPLNAIPAGINASPFQIVCHYLNSALNRKSIFDFLIANPVIKQAICQVDRPDPDGSSIRLEEAGSGMIDSATAPFPTVIRYKIVNGQLQES